MPQEIIVIDVIVPTSRVVAVDIYVGGRMGPPGPPGPPGPAGGTAQSYMFGTTAASPPTAGTIRLNNVSQSAATVMWMHYTNDDGVDLKTYVLQRLVAGDTLYVQDRDESAKWQLYECTGIADSGAYATLAVVWKAGGAALTGQKIIITRES